MLLPRSLALQFGAFGLVTIAAIVATVRSYHSIPCPGASEPLPSETVSARIWSLPIVDAARQVESNSEKSFFVSYPQAGRNVFELGPFRLIESWQQPGNDAHTLGPRHVKLWVEPLEGNWFEPDPFIDFPEYFPMPAELRADRDAGLYVLVFKHAEYATKNGELLPPREPPDPSPTLQSQRDRAFVYRVRYHPGHKRIEHRIPLALAAGAMVVAIVGLARKISRLSALALVLAAACVGFTLFLSAR